MGLLNNEHGNFITIYDGKFAQRVPEGTLGAVTRENKLGKIVTEKYHDSFIGKLIGIKVKDGTYGKQWLFSFRDGGDIYILQLPYSGSMSTAILKMLPNLDLTKEMKLTPSVKEIDGKKQSSMFINQEGNPIKHFFTKDNPNDMPDMEQVTVKGVLQWDDTKRLAFLENMVNEIIIPKLPIEESTPSVQSPSTLEEVFGDENLNEEDAPF